MLTIQVIIKGIETSDELVDVLERLERAGFKQDKIIIDFGELGEHTVILSKKPKTKAREARQEQPVLACDGGEPDWSKRAYGEWFVFYAGKAPCCDFTDRQLELLKKVLAKLLRAIPRYARIIIHPNTDYDLRVPEQARLEPYVAAEIHVGSIGFMAEEPERVVAVLVRKELADLFTTYALDGGGSEKPRKDPNLGRYPWCGAPLPGWQECPAREACLKGELDYCEYPEREYEYKGERSLEPEWLCDGGGVSITEWFRKKHGREPGEGFGRIVILKEGEELVITFESDEVREIQTKSGKMPVVDGRDENGEKVSLCISHVALADRLAWLAKKNGGLRGLKVRIKNLGRGNRSYRYSIEVLGQRTLDVAREG